MKHLFTLTALIFSSLLTASESTQRHLQDLPKNTINAADDFGVLLTSDASELKQSPTQKAYKREATTADLLQQD